MTGVRRALLVAVVAVVAAAGALTWALWSGAEASAEPVHAAGSFKRLAQPTSGQARLVLDGDRRVLAIGGDFRTKNAPGLVVYMVAGSAPDGVIDDGVLVGRLRRAIGASTYRVPKSIPSSTPITVIVFCTMCHEPWGAVELT
jgi:hypothetical protein